MSISLFLIVALAAATIAAAFQRQSRVAAEVALRSSNERLELMTQATRQVVIDYDVRTQRLVANDVLHTELDHLRGEPVTLGSWLKIVHPEDRERVRANVRACLAGSDSVLADHYRLRRRNGDYASIDSRRSIVRDPTTGAPLRLVSVITDVTDAAAAKADLDRIIMHNRLILEAAAECIYGVDTDGRVTFVNPKATEVFGWGMDDLRGRRLHDMGISKQLLEPAEGLEHATPLPWAESDTFKVLTTGIPMDGEAIFQRKDGAVRPMEFMCRPMRDAAGIVVGGVVTFRDVADRLEVERMKNQLIALVSHELRTPLASIRGSLGLVASGKLGELPAGSKRMVEIAVTNSDRLMRLINNILDVERMESGTIEMEKRPCAAGDVIAASIDALDTFAEDSGVRIERRVDATTLTADADRIVQTLTNLIGNAIKFSPRGATITVSASANAEDVRFVVEDEGRGIPREKLESVFERFQQVDPNDAREKKGTGLGLAICRMIVQQHGGRIWVESEPGHGSRFIFTVPHDESQRRAAIPMRSAEPSPSAIDPALAISA